MHLKGHNVRATATHAEDFERPAEIQYLDVIEDDDGDVAHSLGRRCRSGFGERGVERSEEDG